MKETDILESRNFSLWDPSRDEALKNKPEVVEHIDVGGVHVRWELHSQGGDVLWKGPENNANR